MRSNRVAIKTFNECDRPVEYRRFLYYLLLYRVFGSNTYLQRSLDQKCLQIWTPGFFTHEKSTSTLNLSHLKRLICFESDGY